MISDNSGEINPNTFVAPEEHIVPDVSPIARVAFEGIAEVTPVITSGEDVVKASPIYDPKRSHSWDKYSKAKPVNPNEPYGPRYTTDEDGVDRIEPYPSRLTGGIY